MAYPAVARLELPILQELAATGGSDDVRFLYQRLVGYFPQLEEDESRALNNGHRREWRRLVQRAGRSLSEQRQIERRNGFWSITEEGRKRVSDETLPYSFADSSDRNIERAENLTHSDVQQLLLEIARVLSYHGQAEFEYYDVVWRESAQSPRLSHVFEVQHKGNIDAALAKLKRAYEAQRSRTFLIVASERDTRRAERALSEARTGAFHEIGRATTLLSFEQLRRLHRALTSVEEIFCKVFER